MFNRTTAYVLVAALAAGAALVAAQYVFGPTGPRTKAVHLMPPRELPAFALRQSDGTQLVPGELKGHWTLVFLGFTHCPDICPTTLAEMARAQKQWESLPETVRPRVLFVSVDPGRDTPDRIGEYAHAFHKDTLAATGEPPATLTAASPSVEAFAKSLSLAFAIVPAPEGAPENQYTVDHSASMAVLDPQGRMAGVVQPPLDPKAIADDLITLTEATAP